MKDERLSPDIFKETNVRRCSFCEKTFEVNKFYNIPNETAEKTARSYLYMGIFRNGGKGEPKVVNEGICLNCILTGLIKISNNDCEQAKKILELFYKDMIVKNLGKK